MERGQHGWQVMTDVTDTIATSTGYVCVYISTSLTDSWTAVPLSVTSAKIESAVRPIRGFEVTDLPEGVEGYSVAPGQHCVSDKLNLCIFKYPICFYFHNVNRVHTEISHWTVDKADVRLYGLGDRADLVHFEQQAVAGSLLSSFLYSLGVGHRQVIPNNLDPHLGRQARPGLPVILVKRVLDGHHWKWKRRGLLLINRGSASAN